MGTMKAAEVETAAARYSMRRRWLRRAAAAIGLVVVSHAPGARAEDATAEAHEMMEWGTGTFVLSEVLELAPVAEGRPLRYDLIGWSGGAWNRVWAKAEGDQSTESNEGASELQLLYGRLISPYWDAQVGVRFDVGYGEGDTRTRAALALGLQGLAPGWFEVEPTLFVSQRGDVSGNLTASYDVLLTQRLIVQGRGEAEAAVQDVPELGVGSGISNLELGLRVRYEIVRQFAPYIGVAWERLFMETAEIARAAGAPVGQVSFVAGLRLWI